MIIGRIPIKFKAKNGYLMCNQGDPGQPGRPGTSERSEHHKESQRTRSCDLCPSEVISTLVYISSSQFQLIVEETEFQDHLVHQDLKDFQDHKELKVKLLSNMN